jgi:hypothetical protein
MKTMIVLLLVISATGAFAQSYGTVLNGDPVIFRIPGHPEHASMQEMAAPHYIVHATNGTVGFGVQPLWEFPVVSESVSLGEAARELRKQHATAKKAEKVLSDQQ